MGVACEQALLGAVEVGWEKEGELATMSLEFEYLYRKSQCAMLIGRDDISHDIITLGMYFSIFSLHLWSFPLRTDQQKSDSSVDREPQRNWTWNSNSRDTVTRSPSFSCPAARAPWRACSQAIKAVEAINLFSSLGHARRIAHIYNNSENISTF